MDFVLTLEILSEGFSPDHAVLLLFFWCLCRYVEDCWYSFPLICLTLYLIFSLYISIFLLDKFFCLYLDLLYFHPPNNYHLAAAKQVNQMMSWTMEMKGVVHAPSCSWSGSSQKQDEDPKLFINATPSQCSKPVEVLTIAACLSTD